MAEMFLGCSELVTVYVGIDWTVSQVTSHSQIFSGCTKLKGGAGTTYSSSHTDKNYAHIDGGTSNPDHHSDSLKCENATPK